MTWGQLNDWADGGLEDLLGQSDFEDVKDDQLFKCIALDQFIECLKMIIDDMPSNYDAEYLEHTNMIKRLQAIS